MGDLSTRLFPKSLFDAWVLRFHVVARGIICGTAGLANLGQGWLSEWEGARKPAWGRPCDAALVREAGTRKAGFTRTGWVGDVAQNGCARPLWCRTGGSGHGAEWVLAGVNGCAVRMCYRMGARGRVRGRACGAERVREAG